MSILGMELRTGPSNTYIGIGVPQLTFSEAAESNGGPFIVEGHVRSIDDEDVFEPGIGKVGLF